MMQNKLKGDREDYEDILMVIPETLCQSPAIVN